MAGIWDQSPYGQTWGQPQGASSSSSIPTPAQYLNGTQFFNPGSDYGANNGQSNGWFDTPISGNILEQNPGAAFSFYLQRLGLADNDQAFNKWAYNQQPRFERGYQQASVINPLLTIRDYMSSLPGADALRAEFERQSPMARGERYGNYAPGARWIIRG